MRQAMQAAGWTMLIVSALCGAILWASEPPPVAFDVQREVDCCRDVGLLQRAMVDAMNYSARGDSPSARKVAHEALATTGMDCHWRGGDANPIFVCEFKREARE